MKWLIVIITLFSYLPIAQPAQSDPILLRWEYAFNDSTYRHYRVENAQIQWISELGADGFIDFNANGAAVYDVVLSGDADEGDIQITPLHDQCWRVTLITDYTTLKREWSAAQDFGALCYRQQLAYTLQ